MSPVKNSLPIAPADRAKRAGVISNGMKKQLFLVFVLGIAFWPAISRADQCDLSKGVADLQAQKASSTEELAARKNLLSDVLGCLIDTNSQAESGTQSLPYSKAENTKIRLIQNIKSTLLFYQDKLSQVDSLDLSGSQDAAKAISDWKKNHEEDLARSSYFAIWVKNQAMLDTASLRLSQISYSLTLKPDPAAQKVLDTTQLYLKDAQNNNSLAQDSFEQMSPTADSLSYIRSSLDSMQKAYVNFIQISGLSGS